MYAGLLTLLVGLVALVYGSDRAVESAAVIAQRLGVSVFFVGVTIVAVGSSLPEIATSLYAAAYGHGDLVVGHIVGSATSQITLGVGVVAILSPLAVSRQKVRTYGGGMVVAMLLLLVALWSGDVSHLEGVGLALAYLAFLAVRYEEEDYHDSVRRPPPADGVSRPWFRAAIGVGLVVVGGHLLVTGASGVAESLGTPQFVLGIVTGLGTTAPEIAIAAIAVRRDRGGIAVGTLLGSNITDPLFSLGVGAAVASVHVTSPETAILSVAYMIGASGLVVIGLYLRRGMARPGGLGCLLLYLPPFTFV